MEGHAMILVTGASQGIGLACAHALLERTPAAILITGRSQARLDGARAILSGTGAGRISTMVCDQSQLADVEALICRLESTERLEGAVLTVGVNPMYEEGPRRLHSLRPETIDATVRTNCTHAAVLTAAILGHLRRRHTGVIVWIGSRAAAVGLPGAALYCATKSFLSGLARAVQKEYGPSGIRAHVVHPGLVRTPRTARIADGFAARHALHVAEASESAKQIVDLFLEGNPEALEVDLT
jgi:NAD(P)-dependent dehydrogenase (short-subunit alcohol dehydrogenase family)